MATKKKNSSKKKKSIPKKKTATKKKTITPVKKVTAKEVVKNDTKKKVSTTKKKATPPSKKSVAKKSSVKNNTTKQQKKVTPKPKVEEKVIENTITQELINEVQVTSKIKTEEKQERRLFTFRNLVFALIGLPILIIMLITGFNTLNKMREESSYNKKAKQITAKAVVWAEENQVDAPQIITVNYLIKNKFITPDEANGNYYNPREKDRLLNCNTIYIEKSNGVYNASFNDEIDCDLMISEQLPIELIAKVSSGREIKSGEKVSADIVLIVYSKLKIEKITWYDDGEEIISKENSDSFIINPKTSVNKTIRVVVETTRGNKEFKFIANIDRK